MEESLFAVKSSFDKNNYSDISAVMKKRDRKGHLFLILSLVLILLLYPVCMCYLHYIHAVVFLLVGIVFFFGYALSEHRFKNRFSKSNEYDLSKKLTDYEFFENRIHAGGKNGYFDFDYSMITFFGNTKNSYVILFGSSNVACINKSDFIKGNAEDFTAFQRAKCHKYPYIVKHKRLGAVWLRSIILMFVVIAVTASSTYCGYKIKREPKLFKSYPYSIALNSDFYEIREKDHVMTLKSNNVTCYMDMIYEYDFNEQHNRQYSTNTLDFSYYYASDLKDVTNLTEPKLINSLPLITYNFTSDGVTYYSMDVFNKYGGFYYITRFVCEASRANLIEDNYLQWTKSIEIDDARFDRY